MNTEEIHKAINGVFVNEHEKQDYVFTKLIEALDTIDAKDKVIKARITDINSLSNEITKLAGFMDEKDKKITDQKHQIVNWENKYIKDMDEKDKKIESLKKYKFMHDDADIET